MTKPKTHDDDDNLEPIWAEATKAKSEAEKARAVAAHSAATVVVAHEAHATALAKAAEHRLLADAADKRAQAAASKARQALEKGLGLAAGELGTDTVPPVETVPPV